MPGFIRQTAALPTRESAKKSASSKKHSAFVDPSSSFAKNTTSSINLTSPTKSTSKKRASPDTSDSPSSETLANNAKKTRTTSPLPTTSATSPQEARGTSLPSSLPANASDYIHDPTGLLPSLMESHHVCTMQIISSSKMSAKIARSLDTLVLGKINMADVKCKPGLVVMYAKAPVTGKLVSCVEVVKREIGSKRETWYQYNVLTSTMSIIPRPKSKTTNSGKKDDAMDLDKEEDGEEETYFETMKTKQERVVEGTDRMRAVPVLTVYLSRVPIEKLRAKYGEQTNARK